MTKLLQILCLIVLVGIVHGGTSLSLFDDDWFNWNENRNSTFLSMFRDMNRMMQRMNERLQQIFDATTVDHHDDTAWKDERKQLDAVEPVCTTAQSNSSGKNRRKQYRNTQTRTCIKELVNNGKKQLYKETNITDENGHLISQSKVYQTVLVETNNQTVPVKHDTNKNVNLY